MYLVLYVISFSVTGLIAFLDVTDCENIFAAVPYSAATMK